MRSLLEHAPAGDDQGAVTAEFAMVLPAVIVMAALLMSLTRAVTVSMDCQDAAAAAARQLVITAGEADANAVARSVAGAGAVARVSHGEGAFTVNVQCPVLPGPLNILPTRVHASATGIEQ
ncbi:TadE/TadG family type IV pilus assembly protein [Bifidobacterium sp.]|uniref:TadE/TadG family type IV pilus assembly protein n=1 Tax=Bifidobacterium sp. TaxID=41200 RepID=UPI003DA929C4